MSSPFVSIPPVVYTPSLLSAAAEPYWLGDVAKVHEIGITGEGEIVGVLGTGLDVEWASRLKSQGLLHKQATDDNGHESGVVSLVHAVAPKARIAIYKCLNASGSGNMDDCVQAVRRAIDDGCTVLNLSWGGSAEYHPLVEALKDADAAGILIAAAAGNEGIGRISYPAASRYTWSVGAHDAAYRRAEFSSRKPDSMAGGVNNRVWALRGGWTIASGTSFATPCEAGAMALWLQAMRSTGQTDRSGSVWKDDILATSRDMDSAGYDETSGAGAIQYKALIDRVLGRTPKPPNDVGVPSGDRTIPIPPSSPGKRWALVEVPE